MLLPFVAVTCVDAAAAAPCLRVWLLSSLPSKKKKKKLPGSPINSVYELHTTQTWQKVFFPNVCLGNPRKMKKGISLYPAPHLSLPLFFGVFVYPTWTLAEFSENWRAVRAKTTKLKPEWWMYLRHSYQKLNFHFTALEIVSRTRLKRHYSHYQLFRFYGWGQSRPAASWVKWLVFFFLFLGGGGVE